MKKRDEILCLNCKYAKTKTFCKYCEGNSRFDFTYEFRNTIIKDDLEWENSHDHEEATSVAQKTDILVPETDFQNKRYEFNGKTYRVAHGICPYTCALKDECDKECIKCTLGIGAIWKEITDSKIETEIDRVADERIKRLRPNYYIINCVVTNSWNCAKETDFKSKDNIAPIDACSFASCKPFDPRPAKSERLRPDYYVVNDIECKDVIGEFTYNIGAAMKYLWRHGRKTEEGMSDKDKAVEDLRKAIEHIQFEIEKLNK